MRSFTLSFAALVSGAALLAACTNDMAPGDGTKSESEEVADGGSSGNNGRNDATQPSTPPAPANGLAADCANGDEGPAAPSTPEALNAWLQTRAYKCWERESVVHTSGGPHGGNVKVFLNAALAASMKSKSLGEHPSGAVAVKELYGSGSDTVTGWAVGVKNQAASNGGAGWYWYEVFSTEPGETNDIEGQNRSLCSNCHSSGRDFVLITYPLR